VSSEKTVDISVGTKINHRVRVQVVISHAVLHVTYPPEGSTGTSFGSSCKVSAEKRHDGAIL